jgi:predicted ferric reductase
VVKEQESPARPTPVKRRLYGGLVFILFLLVVCGALSIPFFYESKTLWYKVGLSKIMLLGGQMAGLLAAVMLFVQIMLAVRGRILEQIFGMSALMRWHRMNGSLICLFALSHVVLVIAPEGIDNLPIGRKYWPEMLGAGLFLIILSMVISSHFRQRLGLAYKRWRFVHKVSGYLALFLVTVHVLFVSDSFEQGLPKAALLIVFSMVLIWVILAKKRQ